ncbi:MAG: hypothetical protein Q9166_006825 [cf. Caloplaca sp. 2 TL-2023]
MFEEFTLGPLKSILESHDRAFCRLLMSTIGDAVGGRMISTQVDGKDMICEMRSLPTGFNNISGPSKLCVSLSLLPEVMESNLIFQSCQPRDDLLAREVKFGRCVQSPQIDYNQINAWYQNCLDGECGSSLSPPPEESMFEDFRVIDVERHCIVDYDRKYRYIALSYVSGGIETLRNTKRTRPSLEVDGALLERTHQLPGTVKDAMSLVKILGESPQVRLRDDVIQLPVSRCFQAGAGPAGSERSACNGDALKNGLPCYRENADSENYYTGGYVMVPGEITTQLSNEAAATYDFVMISRTKALEQKDRGEGNPDLLDDSEDISLERSYFPVRPDVKTSNETGGCDPRGFDLTKPWCLYNIVLVEWKDEVAYRLGGGRIRIDAWAQARPKKNIIVLG